MGVLDEVVATVLSVGKQDNRTQAVVGTQTVGDFRCR